MFKILKARPKSAVFLTIIFVVAAFFFIRSALRIQSDEQINGNPRLLGELEYVGKSCISEGLGISVPDGLKLDIVVSKDGRVWLAWYDNDGGNNYKVVFKGASLINIGDIQQMSAYIVLDPAYYPTPYTARFVDYSQNIFKRMMGKELPSNAPGIMRVYADMSMEYIIVDLTWPVNEGKDGSELSFNAIYKSNIYDFENFIQVGFFIKYNNEVEEYGHYDDTEIADMVSSAKIFVSDVFGDSYSLDNYKVREHYIPVQNKRDGVVCSFTCGQADAQQLIVFVKGNDIRECYLYG